MGTQETELRRPILLGMVGVGNPYLPDSGRAKGQYSKGFQAFLVSVLHLYRGMLRRPFIWLLIIVLLVVKMLFFESFVVPQASMSPTILPGDKLYAQVNAYGWLKPFTREMWSLGEAPKRGDIVTFLSVHDPNVIYIKRVVAVPGDRIALKGTRLFIKGVKVTLKPTKTARRFTETIGDVSYDVLYDQFGAGDIDKITLKEDEFFVMGDNRDASYDSRYWGPVPRRNIFGRFSFRWWPWSR